MKIGSSNIFRFRNLLLCDLRNTLVLLMGGYEEVFCIFNSVSIAQLHSYLNEQSVKT